MLVALVAVVAGLCLMMLVGLLWSGLGRSGGNGRDRTLVRSSPKKILCDCGHSIVYHAKAEVDGADRYGVCRERVENDDWYDDEDGERYLDCRCQGYQGPTPLPEYFAPEIDGGDSP